MCIDQTLIKNRKYSMTQKNGGIVPRCNDRRQQYVWIPCKQCYICSRKKAREWRMRITEDIKVNTGGKIVTLTFNTESLKKLSDRCKGLEGYELDNQICREAVKLFRERWRKKYGRSPRHWLITELGHGETEHVHMHGIIWEDKRYKLEGTLLDEVEKIWGYGFVGKGKMDYQTGKLINYVDARTANYFTKYVNKIDAMHREYKQIILTSAGIGKNYIGSEKAIDNEYKGEKTNQMYSIDSGGVLPMPEYFRKKLYTEEQREKLAGWYLDKEVTYIDGKEISLKLGNKIIFGLIKELRTKNKMLGYGADKNGKSARRRFENEKRKKLHKKRFWEGKTKTEIKKEQERYWKLTTRWTDTDKDFWDKLIAEAKEEEARITIQSAVKPNEKWDTYKEKTEYITNWETKTKEEKIIKTEIYRYNVIDEKNRVKNRYTLIEEENSEARIKAGRKLKRGERISRVY